MLNFQTLLKIPIIRKALISFCWLGLAQCIFLIIPRTVPFSQFDQLAIAFFLAVIPTLCALAYAAGSTAETVKNWRNISIPVRTVGILVSWPWYWILYNLIKCI